MNSTQQLICVHSCCREGEVDCTVKLLRCLRDWNIWTKIKSGEWFEHENNILKSKSNFNWRPTHYCSFIWSIWLHLTVSAAHMTKILSRSGDDRTSQQTVDCEMRLKAPEKACKWTICCWWWVLTLKSMSLYQILYILSATVWQWLVIW